MKSKFLRNYYLYFEAQGKGTKIINVLRPSKASGVQPLTLTNWRLKDGNANLSIVKNIKNLLSVSAARECR